MSRLDVLDVIPGGGGIPSAGRPSVLRVRYVCPLPATGNYLSTIKIFPFEEA